MQMNNWEEGKMKNQWKPIFAMLMLIPALASSSVFAAPAASNGKAPVMIAGEVRHRLLRLPYYGVFDWLECEIRPDNSVVLRGQVTRPTLKSDAEVVLHRIEGVTKVENQIQVLPISTSDDQLRVAIYRSLFSYNGPMFRYAIQDAPPIHIIVDKGRVTLKGSVDNSADSQIATFVANGISGVLEVRNELKA